jgi:cytochrome c-type biogenesis protein CcsB
MNGSLDQVSVEALPQPEAPVTQHRSAYWLALYDEITYRCVMIGFPLLAVGIILGGLWANEAWGNYWSWDPKESMSLVTLLAYGVYLHLRVAHSSRQVMLAWVSVGGFLMMLITYFGVNIMGLGLHSYGRIG